MVSQKKNGVLGDNRDARGTGDRFVCVGKVFYVRKGVGSVKKAKNGNRIFDCVDFGMVLFLVADLIEESIEIKK